MFDSRSREGIATLSSTDQYAARRPQQAHDGLRARRLVSLVRRLNWIQEDDESDPSQTPLATRSRAVGSWKLGQARGPKDRIVGGHSNTRHVRRAYVWVCAMYVCGIDVVMLRSVGE